MFRIFLKKKLLEGDGRAAENLSSKDSSKANRTRNRRVFERYSIDHKHLMLMNEQDILLVKEISAKGFSTEVSQRTADRLKVGDVYAARVRYIGEVYDLDARVSWKSGQHIGFEITKADRTTLLFLRRLLQPIEIAASLREVNSSFMLESSEKKLWFHGDAGTDLYIWHDEEEKIIAWQLVSNEKFIEWQRTEGLRSGSIVTPSSNQMLFGGGGLYGTIDQKDETLDSHLKQFAMDIFIAFQKPFNEELLETITSENNTPAIEQLG